MILPFLGCILCTIATFGVFRSMEAREAQWLRDIAGVGVVVTLMLTTSIAINIILVFIHS